VNLSNLGAISNQDLALAVLMAGTVPNNFSAPCPSWFTISSPFFHEQEAHDGNVKRIYQGMAAGSALSLVEGYAVSVLADTWLPLVFTVAIVSLLDLGYWYAMTHPATDET
jgi:hypothetical protein